MFRFIFSRNYSTKKKIIPHSYLDTLKIQAFAGSGGNGMHEIDGLGGFGGHVIGLGTRTRLEHVKNANPSLQFYAGTGDHSKKKKIYGKIGKCCVINLPTGVTIKHANGEFIGSINKFGDKVLIARGGKGGNKENKYVGERGQQHSVTLELQLLAQIGLVGFPNAGKSTLLKALTRADPKIGEYPFTTLYPNLGQIMYKDDQKISIVDIPGIIEGAHANEGLGLSFLRHVARTEFLIYVVDINGFHRSPNHSPSSAIENLLYLNKELELYKPKLIKQKSLLVVNKCDFPGVDQKYLEFLKKAKNIKEYCEEFHKELKCERYLTFEDVIPVSALKGFNIPLLKDTLQSIIKSQKQKRKVDLCM